MESIKKNWPQVVAVSVVAIALGVYVYKSNNQKLKVHVVADATQIDTTKWPTPRRIIDCDAK